MKKTKALGTMLLVFVMLFGLLPFDGRASAEDESGDEAQELYHVICDVCPVETGYVKNIKMQKQPDGLWTVTFDSFYGPFLYVIDLETREIRDSEEPDIEAARAQTDFREPMEFGELLSAAFRECPLGMEQTGRITSSMRTDDTLALSFTSAYGEFLYVLDPFTGKVLEKEEPERNVPSILLRPAASRFPAERMTVPRLPSALPMEISSM